MLDRDMPMCLAWYQRTHFLGSLTFMLSYIHLSSLLLAKFYLLRSSGVNLIVFVFKKVKLSL